MKSNKIAIFAILLWVVTVAVFITFFIRGNTVSGTDNRTAIVLKAGERELVLNEMRGLLATTQGIVEGLNQNDMKRVAQAAQASGMASAADVNPALMAKLPLSFKSLGMSVHHDMDDIAKAAAEGKPTAELQKQLGNTLAKCVACHSAWQIKAE
ncbi:MAG: hypothetical protein FD173_1424 [Gallionellaceae bacterium]|nr:MAG: hypothetical protein FD173_1424 [Gallionellaceae bacterium]